MPEIIGAVVSGICFFVCLIISIMQFREKAFLLNNAYIWASKQERESMDKKPHYQQSGVVFALCSVMFLCIALECMFMTSWLWICIVAVMVLLFLYAIVSSLKKC